MRTRCGFCNTPEFEAAEGSFAHSQRTVAVKDMNITFLKAEETSLPGKYSIASVNITVVELKSFQKLFFPLMSAIESCLAVINKPCLPLSHVRQPAAAQSHEYPMGR